MDRVERPKPGLGGGGPVIPQSGRRSPPTARKATLRVLSRPSVLNWHLRRTTSGSISGSSQIGTVSWRFEVVSTDFAKVIRRLNEYFGTSLREFEHTEGYAARCFAILVAQERSIR
jgi:hypothetical protein